MRTGGLWAFLAAALLAGVAAPAPGAPLADVRTEWIDVAAAGSTLRAAVVRPVGAKAVPVVVVLHDRSGFRPGSVWIAESLARAGYVAVAGCWFRGSGENPAPADVIACPGAPQFRGANLDSIQSARALIEAARRLSGVRGDRVGVFGHSLGATAAIFIASTGGEVAAVVASAPRTTEPASTRPGSPAAITLASGVTAPILLLHGTADAVVPVQQTRDYEQALRALGKPVEAHYYEDTAHELPFLPTTSLDVLRRSLAFFERRLGDVTPPGLSVTVGGGRAGAAASRGLRTSVRCSEACSVRLALTLRGTRLGVGSGRLAAAGTAQILVKPTGGGRTRLPRLAGTRLTLTARATDAAGNVTAQTRTVTLRA